MKKTTTEKTLIAAALALGLAVSASAQQAQSAPPAQDAGSGLIGTSYSEFSVGYQKQEAMPDVLHDYNLFVNGALLKEGSMGLDANFSYDYASASALGFHDYRNDFLVGATGYLAESWGKPFITADAGLVTQQTAGTTSNALGYTFTGGVEVPIVHDLFLTPFVSYIGDPHLQDHDPVNALLPNYTWYYGIKATYRISREWSASLSAQLDQHSSNDFGFRAGVSYNF